MKFYLSETNKKLGGVCGGIAETFHFEPSIVRIIFILLVLMVRFYPLIIYMVLWAILPKQSW